MRVLKPVNQKSIYHSFSDLYEKIMNDEITDAKAEIAVSALAGMNRTYALEIKRAEVENLLKGNSEKTEIRTIEVKNFDQIPIEEGKKE
jgi:YesN/AraC family two-component response regulator